MQKGKKMHEAWMRRAIELSKGGYPAPNPHVGCVIIKDNQVVGEGFHLAAGGPHAEAVALAQAGTLAEGADVYVTLEPCNHHGRTPPCAQALIQARVARVFVASLDPNPVASGGAHALREAGIPVESGILEREAETVNWQFFNSLRLQRPVVTVKLAMGLDGRIALPNGVSKWITGPESRDCAQRLRAEAGAVLVGYRTVLMDDPELTARIEGVQNQPIRVILDPDSKLNGSYKVFNKKAQTLHITGRNRTLRAILQELAAHKIRGVLVEGGAGVISQFVQNRLVDRFKVFIAPKLLGEGLSWINLPAGSEIQPSQIEFRDVSQVGHDLLITAFPREQS